MKAILLILAMFSFCEMEAQYNYCPSKSEIRLSLQEFPNDKPFNLNLHLLEDEKKGIPPAFLISVGGALSLLPLLSSDLHDSQVGQLMTISGITLTVIGSIMTLRQEGGSNEWH